MYSRFLVVSIRLQVMPLSMAALRSGFAVRVEVTVLGERGTTRGDGERLGTTGERLAGNSLETSMDMSDIGL